VQVELIDYMGDDLRVANAARVSFAKESDWEITGWTEEVDLDSRTVTEVAQYKLSEQDTKLIHYLAKHGHWSPFSHCFLSFRIKAPIFVARQLAKHQVGLAWNEVSRRYVDSNPEFYVPDGWRKRAENVKQGSSDTEVYHDSSVYNVAVRTAVNAYDRLLDDGVCPEQARMVLPQSMYTEWYWSGSLYAFARVCKLRLDSHAQVETREVAKDIEKSLIQHFPVSYAALSGSSS
jgi:thymidylate synthase (FAD)